MGFGFAHRGAFQGQTNGDYRGRAQPKSCGSPCLIGRVAYRHDWDFQTADREFQEAITLNPSYSRAHQWYGVFLAYMGRFDQAFSELTQAQSLDPFSPIIQSDIAVTYYLSHQNQEAVTRLRKLLEANPDFIPALTNLG